MTKRVSIKGQGAEIFFDEPHPTESQPETPSSDGKKTVSDRPLPSPESKPARKTVGEHASQPTSRQDSLPASKQTSTSQTKTVVANLDATARLRLLDLIGREHRTHNTYRYHTDELATVRDIVYELEVRWGAKVTRNDIMRAAIIWATEDYKEQGNESFLVRLFRKEKR